MKVLSLIVAAMFCGLTASAAEAQSQSRSGLLSCTTGVGIGLILGSTKSINCVFSPDGPGPQQAYAGRMNRVGLDIGITAGTVIKWLVFGGTRSGVPDGALAGRFVGASGEGTIGVGVGANVMVGGTNNAYSLQPLSVQGQAGLNLALGVAGITLQRVN